MNPTDVAAALFSALANDDEGTVRALCAEDFSVTQNHGPPMNLEQLLAYSRRATQALSNFHYAEAVCSATATGFVEEHLVRGTLPDGSELNLPVCVVAELEDGKVSRVREYADSYAARGLSRAIQNS